MDIQSFIDICTSVARDTRKGYHVCLGDLLESLRQADPTAWVGLHNPHSYRGYYADLALEPANVPIQVWQLINELSDVIDTTLTGYKGGEFLMEHDTPVWVAPYGDLGVALIQFNPTTATFTTKEVSR